MSEHQPSAHQHHAHHHHGQAAGGVKDPVCGMTVDPATSKHQATHQGQVFHFCSNGCLSLIHISEPTRPY